MNKSRNASWIITLIAIFFMILFLKTQVFEIAIIEGNSMNHTLKNGERVWLDVSTYKFQDPGYGDIIVCKNERSDTGDYLIKRIIGKPGDFIELKQGRMYKNGEEVNSLYWDGIDITLDTGFKNMIVPPDCYFVVGDNVNNSLDSRIIGPIDKHSIIGKAVYVLYPFKNIRYLY